MFDYSELNKAVSKDNVITIFDLGYIKAITDIKDYMLETFGGDDGSGNLDKIYTWLSEKKEEAIEKARL